MRKLGTKQVSLCSCQFKKVSLENHEGLGLHGAMRAWYSPYDDLKVLFSRFLSILSEEKNRFREDSTEFRAQLFALSRRRRQEKPPMSASASETKTPILRKSKWTKHSVQLVPRERGRAETSQSTSVIRDPCALNIYSAVSRSS